MNVAKGLVCVVAVALGWQPGLADAEGACRDLGVQLQILGSGGPGSSGGRASSGYLIWIDGVGRLMIDAGGGTKTAFHDAGASLEDLQFLGLSHFHPDHSAEVPALLWPGGATMRVAGPSGNEMFPAVDRWLDGLLGPEGVFPVLANRVQLDTTTVDVTSDAPSEVFRDGGVRVTALGVPHADVPAVGYRVDVGSASVAFSSDQNGSNPAFIGFVQDVDLLVVHLGGGEDSAGRIAALHARPSVWGQMATDADIGHLVISHISSIQNLDSNLRYLRQTYTGPLTVGEDLLCVPVG